MEKFIGFTVAGYEFALPIREVLQIVKCPHNPNELSQAGIVQIGRHLIRLLDVHQLLEKGDSLQTPRNRSFLVITQSLPGELWAIPVGELPNLIEFPIDQIQALPQSCAQGSEFQSGVLRVASHAAIVTQDETTTTVFLLNLKRLLTPIAVLPGAD